MNAIVNAYNHAKGIVNAMLEDAARDKLHAELESKTKDELIAMIMADRASKPANIMDIAYALLTDTDCTWLSYDQLAAVIRAHVPGAKTKESNLRWYFSKQTEFGYDCLVRRSSKEITSELLKESR